jgi:hypothetical protein
MQSVDLAGNPQLFVGAFDFDQVAAGLIPRRLPAFTRQRLPAEMQRVVTTPSGVRIEFLSDTTEIALVVHLSLIQAGRRVPAATIDLVVDGQVAQSVSHAEGDLIRMMTTEESQTTPGPSVCYRFEGLEPRLKRIALWLPVNAVVTVQSLRIDDGASLSSVVADKPRWVHYGSSISQCAEAASPTQTWPAIAADKAGVHLTSLGFGGQCHLDLFVAQTIRDLPAAYISLKVGINIVNQNSLGRRAFASALHGFLDIIRAGRHAQTPILLISPIFCPFSEDTPGPTTATIISIDGQKKLVFDAIQGHEPVRQNALTITQMRRIMSELIAARRADGDAALDYVDGLTLFSAADQQDLPDNLHPNAAGYARMGERFAKIAFDQGLFNRLLAS